MICFTSPTKKSSVKDAARIRTGPAEKSAAATKPDTKGRTTVDHHGEFCQSSVSVKTV